MHFPGEKHGFLGGTWQETAEYRRRVSEAQESRTIANFHKTLSYESLTKNAPKRPEVFGPSFCGPEWRANHEVQTVN